MKRQPLLILLFLLVAGLLVLPKIGLALDLDQLSFPEKDTKQLLHTLIQLMTDEWVFLKASGYATPEEETVPLILRKAVRIDVLKYLLIDAPFDITSKIITNGIKIARLASGLDVSVVLKEIEKTTVKLAVDKGMEFLLQNEIRTTPGALSVEYVSKKGNLQKAVFQYIIVFKPLHNKQGEVGMEIYSPVALEPPESVGSVGIILGTPNALETNLPPFIVKIKGKVEKGEFGYYSWLGTPEIKISFPEYVPDLGFKPLSFWERHLWKPLEEKVKEVEVVLQKTVGSPAGTIVGGLKNIATKAAGALKNTTLNLVNKLKESLGGAKPEAQIAGIKSKSPEPEPPSPQPATDPEAAPIAVPTRPGLVGEEKDLNDIIEQFDEISERAEILLAQAETLLTEKQSTENRYKIGRPSDFVTEERIVMNDTPNNTDTSDDTSDDSLNNTLKNTEEKNQKSNSPESKPTPQLEKEFTPCSSMSGDTAARNKIIFNEIAWMGTTDSSNHEWIELKNISSNPVELTGWQLLDKASQIKIMFENITLQAGGFLLLERTGDESVSNIAADIVYTGALSNSYETVELYDAGCRLQDRVIASPSWPAGDNSSKQTMERKSDLNWQTSQNVGGTPKAENSTGAVYQLALSQSAGANPESSEPTFCSIDETALPSRWPIIFNEIAWMGTIESWRQEWLELKNISTTAVSLSNWQVLDKNGDIKIRFGSAESIPGNGFYVLEREEGAIPHITADKIYSGYLNNNNESLWLFDENCDLIDRVLATPDWPGGDNTEKKTMERAGNLTWHTFEGEANNGILGTPGQENSEPLVEKPDGSSEEKDSGDGEEPEPETPDTEPPVSPPVKILISEVQTEGQEKSHDFIELYNPTNSDIYLQNYRLVKRSKTSTQDTTIKSWSREPDAKISSFSYYLWVSSQDKEYPFVMEANASTSQSITDDNGIALRYGEENTGLMIDAVGWGGFNNVLFEEIPFPESPETRDPIGDWLDGLGFSGSREPFPSTLFEQSLGRKTDQQNTYQDTNNNAEDFELQNPTPKAKNEGFTEPILEDILKALDAVPPEADIIANPPVLTNQTQATFAFSANEEGTAFQCKIDEEDWQNCTSPTDYRGLTDGPHLFQVKAADLVGNPSEISEYNWTVDTNIESPLLSLADLDSGSTTHTNNQTLKVEILQDKEATAWFLSENSEKPAIDNVGWLTDRPSNFSPSVNDGIKTVYIWTKDAASNISQLGNSAIIVLDTTPPLSQVEELAASSTSTVLTIKWSGSDGGGGALSYDVQYKDGLDGEWQYLARTTTSLETSFTGEDKHTYYFRSKATDTVGNEEAWPEEYDAFIEIKLPKKAPTAYFSYTPNENLMTGDEIVFNAASSTDPDGKIVFYAWNFGDSNSTTTGCPTTTHSYAAPDDYTVLLTVLDEEGATSSAARNIHIEPLPSLSLIVTFPSQNQVFTSSSPDTNNTLSGFQTIAEGTTTAQALVSASQATTTLATTTASTTGKWELEISLQEGENIFVFKAEDKFGQSATTSLILFLDTIPPPAINDLIAAGSTTETITLAWTAPEQAIEYDIRYSTSTINGDSWDSAHQIPNEPLPADPDSLQTFTITGFSSNILYYFAIKSEDENGNISGLSNQASAETLNQAPSAMFSYECDSNPPELGDEITFDASLSSDPDGEIVFFIWDFSDGTITTTQLASIDHSFSTLGQFQVLLQVVDNEGATSTPVSTTFEIIEKPKPKILISEVQIADSESTIHDFIELYNPNDTDVYLNDCSGGYIKLMKRTKTGTENKGVKSWRNDPEAKITAREYYLWASSEDENYPFSINADAWTKQIVSANNGVALTFVRDEKEFIIDAMGWGDFNNVLFENNAFPQNPEENQTLGRKWSTTTQTYQDTDDNQEDFELQTPTPKAQNEKGNILPPEKVPNFQVASSTDNTATLTWAATIDFDTPQEQISYILTATSSVSGVFSTTTASTTITLANLDYNATYDFGIRAFDGLHYSPVATTTPFATSLPPINDLLAGPSAQRKAIDLFWTSNGAKSYIVKEGENQIKIISQSSSGEIEAFTVESLTPNTTYYFAVKSVNENNATSAVSNSASAKAIASFRDNGDGTITDLYTGLMWVKDGDSAAANNGKTVAWAEAKNFSNNLVSCNDGTFSTSTASSTCANNGGIKYNDWRLPNFKELASIINYNKNSPTIYENYFQNTVSDKYWTSSYKLIPGYYGESPSWKIRLVDFNNGSIGITWNPNENHYFLPVRGTSQNLQVSGLHETPVGCDLGFQDNGDDTMTDLCTGLMWTKTQLTGIGYVDPASGIECGVHWEKAIKVAESSNLAGYDNWRLPNVRELLGVSGIVVSSKSFHWSSTQDYFGNNKRWFVNFSINIGQSETNSKTMEYYVRLVRNTE